MCRKRRACLLAITVGFRSLYTLLKFTQKSRIFTFDMFRPQG